ncbi:hypothetical protein ElyMa_007004300 [Elysia marginata]|uniref:Uncharacterized protein n=1 Tax=Elysia marginata TaxID=1093978 RepID=A0AAV4JNW1_9GAST|nr:hypothetical protein ElyMa_007004300 [Elysia marginata]
MVTQDVVFVVIPISSGYNPSRILAAARSLLVPPPVSFEGHLTGQCVVSPQKWHLCLRPRTEMNHKFLSVLLPTLVSTSV